MTIYTAGWSWMWMLLFGMFFLGQSRLLGIWVHGRRLRLEDLEGGSSRRRREIDELRADLDGRLAEIDSLQTRVTELENRLDFTERLLAERRDHAALGSAASTPAH